MLSENAIKMWELNEAGVPAVQGCDTYPVAITPNHDWPEKQSGEAIISDQRQTDPDSIWRQLHYSTIAFLRKAGWTY